MPKKQGQAGGAADTLTLTLSLTPCQRPKTTPCRPPTPRQHSQLGNTTRRGLGGRVWKLPELVTPAGSQPGTPAHGRESRRGGRLSPSKLWPTASCSFKGAPHPTADSPPLGSSLPAWQCPPQRQLAPLGQAPSFPPSPQCSWRPTGGEMLAGQALTQEQASVSTSHWATTSTGGRRQHPPHPRGNSQLPQRLCQKPPTTVWGQPG